MSALAKRERKHAAWQNHVCHLFIEVSTVTEHGSTSVAAIAWPQKQQGPQRTSFFGALAAAMGFLMPNY